MTNPTPRPTRRSLLLGATAVAGAGLPVLGQGPARAAGLLTTSRPRLTHGVQTGDVGADGAVVWARSDRPARMFVQVSATGSFSGSRVRTVRGPLLTASSDFTGRHRLRGLPAGRDVAYRVVLADPDAERPDGDSRSGTFRTAPSADGHDAARDVRFVWTGDHSGQGWGRNPDIGGFPIFAAMAARQPDFLLHSGDSIYADGPITGDVTLPDGRVYRNVLDEAKAHVAQTLADFRGNYKYNLADASMQAFTAHVPVISQWDDHEVVNNWYPGEILDDARYTEKRVDVLAARAHRAFREFFPVDPRVARGAGLARRTAYGPLLDVVTIDMRPYRDANSPGLQPGEPSPLGGILGGRQARWLVEQLDRSRATWKVVQSDMPLGLVVGDGPLDVEAVAQGDPGAPLGRERQIAWVLREIHRRGIENVVWVTADVHYTAAHHYDPSRAAFTEFTPFWEFVSGPMHAGGFGPGALDATFGPRAEFVAAPPRQNVSPLEGFQYFGEVGIDGASRRLTVDLRDLTGASLWSTTLEPV